MNPIRQLILLILLLTAGIANAQDTRFTYLGVLNDNLALGGESYDFEVRLFDGEDLAALEVAPAVTVLDVLPQGGAFSLELDFGSEAFAGPERWLEIAVRESGTSIFEVLGPRQRIAAVPRAMNADSAPWSGLSGIPSSLLDGDDDLLALLASSCLDQQVPVYDSARGAWACGDAPQGPEGPEGPAGPKGDQGDPGPIGDLSCESGQIARFNGRTWACSDEATVQALPNCGRAKGLGAAGAPPVAGQLKGTVIPGVSSFIVSVNGPQSSGPQDDAPWLSFSGGRSPLPSYQLCDANGTVSWEFLGQSESEPLELTGILDCGSAKAATPTAVCRQRDFRVTIDNAPSTSVRVTAVSLSDLVWGELAREPVIITLGIAGFDTAVGEMETWVGNIERGVSDIRNIVVDILDRGGSPATSIGLQGCTAIGFGSGLQGGGPVLTFELEAICNPPDILFVMPALLSWPSPTPPTGNSLAIELRDFGDQTILIYEFNDVRPLRVRFPVFRATVDDRATFGLQFGFTSKTTTAR